MSILKGIMHHWNKTKNDYDIIHPETDYKKITDWNEGIVATLASTALGTLVSTLTSDSLLATMIQKVLTATGVKYNIAQNGYVCFGSLFGNIIIQWGLMNDISPNSYITLPISSTPLAVLANDINMKHEPLILATYYYENGKFMIDGRRIANIDNIWGHWIAICI